MKTTTNFNTKKMVQLALFTAIVVLMSFTPLGYFKTPVFSITLLSIPVAVGAIVLGPVAGAFLGTVFGISSFVQCFGMDAFGTFLFTNNPFGTFVTMMVARILMGWFTGLIFVGIKKIDRTKNLTYAVTCLAAPILNTIFFMTALMIFFFNNAKFQEIDFVKAVGANNALTLAVGMVGFNALVEAVVCFIIGTAIAKAIDIVSRRSGMNAKSY